MNNRNKKRLSSVMSLVLAVVMMVSMLPTAVFAAETSTSGDWTIVKDAAASLYTATDNDTGMVYISPTDFTVAEGTEEGVTKTYVRSASNGTAKNGIVTITDATRAWCEYVPEKDGTLTVYVGKANTKTGYVSRTDANGTAEALGTFIPCGVGEFDNDYLTVVQGKNWATISIEVVTGYTYYVALSGSKMICYGADFTPYTLVSGTVTDPFNLGTYDVKFTNQTTGKLANKVTVTDGKYSCYLKPGFTYSASLMGSAATDYAIDPTTRLIEVSSASETQTADLKLIESVSYKFTGSLKGIADDYDISDMEFKLIPTDTANFETVTADFDQTARTIEAQLVANETYTLEVTGGWDYELAEALTVTNATAEGVSKDVNFNAKTLYAVNGGFLGLTQVRGEYETLNVTPTAITFTNVSDVNKGATPAKYTYTGTAADAKYSVSLREGSYLATITSPDYTTTTHVVVNAADTTRNLLLKPNTLPAVEYKDTVYVGKDKEYKSLYSAIQAITNMSRPNGERVTVKIDPGTYREQLYIDTPNVTFESNGGTAEDTKITWYYGIGYKYYSTVNSVYDPYADYDKFNYGNVTQYWGAAVIPTANAKGFKAKDITFENSFNKYMTNEEIADGVAPNGIESINVQRKKNTVVDSKTATERAGALTNYADQVEFLNCKFIGSQDTLYTSNKVTDGYYKNCYIEGQTDFIYGNGNIIFDNCEINFCGYNGSASGGYLTAQSCDETQNATAAGYIFRNCYISYNDERMVTPGTWGRMWGKGCKVAFLNTELEDAAMIANPGWTAMGGTEPTASTVTLVEYNTTCNGEKVDLSGRVAGTALDTVDMSKYSVEAVFADRWTPTYYTGDVTTTPEFKDKPALASNGDLNAPNPGEKVSAVYTLGADWADEDASRIAWYAVPETADLTSLETILKTAKLLKSTTVANSISFQIPMECAGNYIMAVVTPATVSGVTGTAEYAIRTEKVVSNVWSDPENPDIPAPGQGINIYLAGDSTVKDYSAKGMYNGGKILEEGSWGEFIQEFFNEDAVTINNYAQGGRASRSFINEGKFDNILTNIKEGDYLFVQFGHNDCANGTAYYLDRYVPLYTSADQIVDGVYPTILPEESMKTETPASLKNSISASTYYAWDCGATYKGYLQYYINKALEKGATPVIVSPVARLYYNADGTIRAHHDSTATDYAGTANLLTSNNAYVTACQQVYEANKDKGVLYLDAFNMTKDLYEKAYKDTGSTQAGLDIMAAGETTHSSKTGGVLQAGMIAKWVKENIPEVAKYVKAPTSVYAEKPNGQFIFEIDENGKFTGKDNNFAVSDYWTNFGTELFASLATGSEGDTTTTEPTTQTTTDETTTVEPGSETTTVEPGSETTTDKEPESSAVVEGKYGDANGDDTISADDAALVLKYVRDNDLPLTEIQKKALSLGLDKVTAKNSAYVLKKAKNPDYALPNGDTFTIEVEEKPADATLFVLGDSTACNYAASADAGLYYKRVGFGTPMNEYFKENITVNNLALSGRSSKDFITTPEYQTYLSSVKAGDYVLIAFGHNDEKAEDSARYTAPGGTKETEGTFKHSVYTRYIVPALEAGATPILCTSIVRRTDTESWSDSKLHKANGGDYPQDMKDLAAELGLTCIDATQLTKDLYDELTPANTFKLHSWGTSKSSSVDNTHLNNYGAKYVAYLIAEAIKASDSKLASSVKDGNVPPTDADLIVNPDYKEAATDDPTDLTSKLWSTTSPWYGSVFGDIGGDGKLFATDEAGAIIPDQVAINSSTGVPFYDIKENADGTVSLRSGGKVTDAEGKVTTVSVGKIAGTTDGIAMYYQPIQANGNFEISATMTINAIDKNSQVACGAIISDMVRVDTNIKEMYNYVAASPFRLADIGATNATTGEIMNGVATYARIDGSLTRGPAVLTEDVTAGTTVKVAIKKIGNKFYATYGDTTQEYELAMTGTAYAGFFTSRCADVTFSDIVYNNEVVE